LSASDTSRIAVRAKMTNVYAAACPEGARRSSGKKARAHPFSVGGGVLNQVYAWRVEEVSESRQSAISLFRARTAGTTITTRIRTVATMEIIQIVQ
jgi:hypothetical protein